MNPATSIVFDRDTFFKAVGYAAERALLINYDGVLAPRPWTVDRQNSFPYPTVPELLDTITTTCRTRLALMTGGPAIELGWRLRIQPSPEIWGRNGFDHLLPDNTYECVAWDSRMNPAIDEAYECLKSEGLAELVERTPSGLVVGWRDQPERKAAEAAVVAYRVLWPFERRPGVVLRRFEDGAELCWRNRTEDVAREFMADLPADAAFAYLGNCATEESAFRAVRNRGVAILVCNQFRATSAQLWLKPPEELTTFLTDWIGACGGESPRILNRCPRHRFGASGL